jgi:hypothetical protein
MKSAELRSHFLDGKGVSFPLLLSVSTGGVNGTTGEMHGHLGIASAGTFNKQYLPDNGIELENGQEVSGGGRDSPIQGEQPDVRFGALLPHDRRLAQDGKLQGDQNL